MAEVGLSLYDREERLLAFLLDSGMQTTLRLDDKLYRRAKATAAEQGVTLTRFIEEALQLRLEKRPPVQILDLPTFNSGQPFNFSAEELKKLGQDSDWGGDER